MDVPIELTITAENADGRRSGTLYEVLRQERIQNDEYMTIGTAIEGNRRKQPSDQQHTDKKPDTIEETLAEQAKYLNRLKLISVILTITVVVVCVTFGVLIHGLMGQTKDPWHASLDGAWVVWSPWAACSSSCGQGTAIRTRTCSNPQPKNGGKTCTGNNTETQHCTLHPCPVAGAWVDWSPWTACSMSCGQGTAIRTRTCSNPQPQNDGKTCTGNNTETKHCIQHSCPVHGDWGTWANWSSCSSTCGPGITRRTRVCHNPLPQFLENFCFGDATEYGMCLIKSCRVDGGWSDWSLWSSCSVTCGNGHAMRKRYCVNPSPANGGLNCAGSQTEQNTCNIAICPVNGGWSTWTSWSSCSSSVARGLSKRQRTCTNPTPSSLGRGCIGDSTEQQTCPVDGGWADWSVWSSCSVTCGDGHATRIRYCVNPTPANGGSNCSGPRTEQNTCKIANCPVNGGWSTWTSWSSCSSSVARGLSQRQRTCTNPTPSSLGRSCIGDSTKQRPCPGVKSAFTASHPVAGLTSGTIRFTQYITNIGGHYSTSTGIFTCEYPGTYVFALHIMKSYGSDYAQCYIRKNRSNVGEAYTNPDSNSDSGWYSSSNSVVIHLVHGDQVNLDSCSPIASIYGFIHTTFSGFLLRAD